MEIKNKMILALDVQNIEDALKIVEDVSEHINTAKIGYPLVLSEGLQSISTIKESFDFGIIADFKVADIPQINKKIADITFQAGADAIIVHGFVGEDSVLTCLDSAEEHDGDVFLLTEMSHPGSSMFLEKISEDIAKMGIKLGIDKFVAPATRLNRLKKIREIVGDDSFIIAPGVGIQGGDPENTLKFADAMIIGRSIYSSESPKDAVKSIINSIEL